MHWPFLASMWFGGGLDLGQYRGLKEVGGVTLGVRRRQVERFLEVARWGAGGRDGAWQYARSQPATLGNTEQFLASPPDVAQKQEDAAEALSGKGKNFPFSTVTWKQP